MPSVAADAKGFVASDSWHDSVPGHKGNLVHVGSFGYRLVCFDWTAFAAYVCHFVRLLLCKLAVCCVCFTVC